MKTAPTVANEFFKSVCAAAHQSGATEAAGFCGHSAANDRPAERKVIFRPKKRLMSNSTICYFFGF
jgi:hypothetical protein